MHPVQYGQADGVAQPAVLADKVTISRGQCVAEVFGVGVAVAFGVDQGAIGLAHIDQGFHLFHAPFHRGRVASGQGLGDVFQGHKAFAFDLIQFPVWPDRDRVLAISGVVDDEARFAAADFRLVAIRW